MTDEKKIKMYLAIDGINGDREEFETIDEARMWLEECFLDPAEGYHPDFASCKIYQLAETVECDVVDKKENYKYTNEGDIPEDDNESEAWPYDTSFDEIWKHRFVPHAAQQAKMPTIGEVKTYFVNHHDCYTYYLDANGIEHSAPAFTVDAVLKMIERLRNQITEK